MIYNIHEIFYSIKGEGQWTGTPMIFIRLSGCNLRCPYCDTDYSVEMRLTEREILAEVAMYPSKRVVITGGEPTIQDLIPLTAYLRKTGYSTHLETNGTSFPEGTFDWIAVSPKISISKLNLDGLILSDEIKFICGTPGWLDIINEAEDLLSSTTLKWLMPLASDVSKEGSRDVRGINLTNTQLAIDYVKSHPDFRLCIQTHKYLNIP